MMEDCAYTMSAPQGCTSNKAVVGIFKEALKSKVGDDRYRMWFDHVVQFSLAKTDKTFEDEISGDDFTIVEESSEANALLVSVHGQFALDRLRNHYLGEMRGAAFQAVGRRVEVIFSLNDSKPQQVELPLDLNTDAGLEKGIIRTSLEAAAVPPNNLHRVDSPHLPHRDSNSPPAGSAERTRRKSKRSQSHRRSRSLGNLLDSSSLNGNLDSHSPARRKRRSRNTAPSNGPQSVQLELHNLDSQTARRDNVNAERSGTSRNGEATEPARSKSDKAIQSSERFATKMHSGNFIPGSSNRLAHTAMIMACQDPSTASPLYLCGPTGTGKTHLLHAIADQLRRRFRLRRVMNLSAEQFTNDFITSVGNSGITSFRRRYRDVDALLVDDVQFLGSKKATLREMLYTVETLGGLGKPLVFAGAESPSEIQGLSNELAGRMASGLVCHMQPLDSEIREKLLRQWIDERCNLKVCDSLIETITPMLSGDGRVISGVVNVLNTLQRMLGRSPSLQELQQFAGQLLRSNQSVATLGLIESAVCQAFHLPPESLRSKSQTRALSGPRKLAMYLSRQLTPSAYSEIGNHFGGRSHSTAISAEQHVKAWISEGTPIGRGMTAMTAREALDRVETLLRTG